jgi:predicted metalloprotease with PDZ domain
MLRRSFFSLLFLSFAAASAEEAVRYTVRFPKPYTHYLEVTASIPADGREVELFMPVWTPGSYMIRDYARNVEDFRARGADGKELAWTKSAKNRWRVQTPGAQRFEATYRVYAREMSVQGNWVDAGFAMLNGAPNFMTLAGSAKRPYEVRVELPAGWKETISGMKSGSAPDSFVAADYDELIDSPIYAGNAPIHEFEVDGKKHYLVNEGEDSMWDGAASARDVQKIVEYFSRQWHGLPYDKYVFFNIITESGGGLEHRNSTWMGASRWAYANTQEPPENAAGEASPERRRPNRHSWHGLVSHEYFHLWNVKRMRPVELGPFNYESEVNTRSLWLAEGVTSYYGPLALRRCGLATDAQFLRDMSNAIRALQTTPGRLAQSAEESSFDAWIKLYRSDENTPNTAISYYTKGEVVGFVLDAKIRNATGGARTLDDVMRTTFEKYSGKAGYTAQQFRGVVNEIAGADFSSWLQKTLESHDEVDYSEALDWYGLRFKTTPQRPGGPPRFETGITATTNTGRIVVTGLRRGTAGYDSGLNVDDEILAVNGYRVRAEQWPARLESYKAGDTVELLVARRDKLTTIRLPLVAAPDTSWSLEVKPDATEAQKAHLQAWLKP